MNNATKTAILFHVRNIEASNPLGHPVLLDKIGGTKQLPSDEKKTEFEVSTFKGKTKMLFKEYCNMYRVFRNRK